MGVINVSTRLMFVGLEQGYHWVRTRFGPGVLRLGSVTETGVQLQSKCLSKNLMKVKWRE